jgi:hypothetical protein
MFCSWHPPLCSERCLPTGAQPQRTPTAPARQASSERAAMEEFIGRGEALLCRSPASAEEIGRAALEARELVERLGEVAQARARLRAPHRGRLCVPWALGRAPYAAAQCACPLKRSSATSHGQPCASAQRFALPLC